MKGCITLNKIFGDDLSISSEDGDDKSGKRKGIEDGEHSNEDEHRVQRYDDECLGEENEDMK